MNVACAKCQPVILPENYDAVKVFHHVTDQIEPRSYPIAKGAQMVSKMVSNVNIDSAIDRLRPEYPDECWEKVKLMLREYL